MQSRVDAGKQGQQAGLQDGHGPSKLGAADTHGGAWMVESCLVASIGLYHVPGVVPGVALCQGAGCSGERNQSPRKPHFEGETRNGGG